MASSGPERKELEVNHQGGKDRWGWSVMPGHVVGSRMPKVEFEKQKTGRTASLPDRKLPLCRIQKWLGWWTSSILL
eukprot:scaffold1353_cov363-Pavlova_lutheri.AAC.2